MSHGAQARFFVLGLFFVFLVPTFFVKGGRPTQAPQVQGKARRVVIVTRTTRPAAQIEKDLRPVIKFWFEGHQYLQFGLGTTAPISHAGSCPGFHFANR